jgi:hypothetical protein
LSYREIAVLVLILPRREAMTEQAGMWTMFPTYIGLKPWPKKNLPPLTYGATLLWTAAWLGQVPGSQDSEWPGHVTFQTNSTH